MFPGFLEGAFLNSSRHWGSLRVGFREFRACKTKGTTQEKVTIGSAGFMWVYIYIPHRVDRAYKGCIGVL